MPEKELFNPHVVGIIMKELVRRAIVEIRNQRAVFEVTAKEGYSGKMDDVFTTADRRAQEIYLKSLRECFPGFGIVAEEDNLQVPCTLPDGREAYFTIDPLDGTKAFIRRQSHGVGTMIALVVDGQVAAAYVGDINTKEIYGFRPESDKVHRINEFETFETLGQAKRFLFKHSYLLLRELPDKYPPIVGNLVRERWFKNVTVDSGSIGIWMARLWKQEMAAVVLEPNIETPWDSTPVIGISQKLGYVFLRPGEGGWEEYQPLVKTEKYRRDHPTLIVHESQLNQLK